MARIGLLWRQEWDPPRPDEPVRDAYRLRGVFAAFAGFGVGAEPVVYSDDRVDEVREQLLGLDGVLVWVNPIQDGLDRSKLDPLLREVAGDGVWVSAHPDVIVRMATKRVLYETREMSWGTDTRLYLPGTSCATVSPPGFADGIPRVLKQQRGMGGEGVWKLVLDEDGADPRVTVQHAKRDAPTEPMPLSAFVARCKPYFENGGLMVEQPRSGADLRRDDPRLPRARPRGRLRSSVSGRASTSERGRTAARQAVRGSSCGALPASARPGRDGLGAPDAAAPWPWHGGAAGDLGHRLSLRAEDESGEDSYVLCEINASSTFAFPEHAMSGVASAALERIAARV